MVVERLRVLLVEDDARLGPLIQQVLDEHYHVTRVVDGDAGLAAGLAQDFDALVIDRRLPGMEGAE
ncbi:DNA-binding response regulator, partial [Leifsonia sp. Le1]